MTTRTKKTAPVHDTQTVSESAHTIFSHHLGQIPQWEQNARSFEDIEGVHQIRVIFRRMRSALVTFRPAISRKHTQMWSDEMRWVASQLGEARDLDVFVEEALDNVKDKLLLPGERALRDIVNTRRRQAYERVRDTLDSSRYQNFKSDFGAWVDERQWLTQELKAKKQKRLNSNVIPFARQALDKHERRVLALGTQINTDSAEELHNLRIECKKLRYATEFFSPLFSGMDTFVNHMKGLQDLLGVMNDVSVMRTLLADLLKNDPDPTAAEFAGGVVGWRTCEYIHLLVSYDSLWEEFVHAKHPWWKKSES